MKLKVQVWILMKSQESPKSDRSGDRVLLLKMNEDRGGYWQPVTGGVDEGEDLRSAAIRELKEETGISLGLNSIIDINYSFKFEGRWGPAQEHLFFGVIDRICPIVLDPNEHTDYQWVLPDQVSSQLHFKSNQEAFERIMAHYG